MKRIVAVFLILCMFIPVGSLIVSAVATYTSGNYEYTLSSGKATITGVASSMSGAVSIPSQLNGYSVVAIQDAAAAEDGVFYRCTGITSITLPATLTKIGSYSFSWCTGMTSVSIPSSVTQIGKCAFTYCRSLSTVVIPDSVTELGSGAFYGCSALSDVTIGRGIKTIDVDTFNLCRSLTSMILPTTVTSIGGYAFANCPKLSMMHIPSSVTTIELSAFYSYSDSFYICCNTNSCYAKQYAQANGIPFQICSGHGISESNIYNLGEETYSFENFGDKDSPAGHCFGMAVTSSGYYLGRLNKSIIHASNDTPLYSISDTQLVRDPICHYIQVQGIAAERAEYRSMVAGGSIDLKAKENISEDWQSCIDYVKNHEYDNKGNLNVGMWYQGSGGHAVNFLYYKEVNGEPRIYVYDNNYPKEETYYYMGQDNFVHQGPKEFDRHQIKGIDLMDVDIYFPIADKYEPYRYIFANQKEITVKGASVCSMKCSLESDGYVMFEIPKGIEEVTITPLVKNAHFQYMEQKYTFDDINNQTYGILEVAEKNADYGDLTTFSVHNAPTKASTIAIRNYCPTRTEDYRTTMTFTSIATDTPDGATTHWFINETDKASGETYTVIEAKNDFTVQAKLIGMDGKVIAESEIETVKIRTGFFAKLKAVIRAIFGRLPKVVQEYIGADVIDRPHP